MTKENQVKAGVTMCDFCSTPSVTVTPDGRALCVNHLDLAKKAETIRPALKSASAELSEHFAKRS